ncbi:MAG: hypothetical protein KKB66_10940 [Alphaproteobacteria bacterium]|nr:hypothetical protein [Alphaproteobacteria bacterium]MBU0804916.1 hypothetical protein [Alphaproteobacteria bacterium]MBU0870415.1 hypothetical protein [Alphaproteobacteria bacterium]MBU1401910.1 hypothetical protein [Alphaproteobacteria bacterium]MBU1591673.1 hypothetical protein [Alphaproteobacteria bacterium]
MSKTRLPYGHLSIPNPAPQATPTTPPASPRDVILVPINDPKRNRTVHAKLDRASFDALPERIRSTAWFIVRDGTAGNDHHFSVRAYYGTGQVTVARLIMNAKPGEFVRNITGDRLDLRTSNLRIKQGALGRRSKRHDLALAKAADSGEAGPA